MDFKVIEEKWQKKWEDAGIFKVTENPKKKKFYCLEFFPYPSGTGLHMGHAFNYIISDIFARFKRMCGFNVLYPVGYDSLGLPAENAAIKVGVHPKQYTEKAISNFMNQQKSLGLSYDWSRMIKSHDPLYYKWDQWIFLKMFERGLAFRKKAAVNWCPKCKTVLANEQVHNGRCWRHEDTDVEIKHLEQWFLKITKYVDELYEFIDKLKGWPEDVKTMQKNWIGKSHGTEIEFEMETNANYVLLHGFEGKPDTTFFPWLKKGLENRKYRVSVPKLPDTNNPDVMKQVRYVLENCKLDENTVLFGHSLGSVVALKVLENIKLPIRKVVLAGGFIEPNLMNKDPSLSEKTFKGIVEKLKRSFNWKFDFDKIRSNVREVVILRAKNDPYIPKEHADSLKERIGGKIIDFVAEDDHICGDTEPVVLENCLEKWPIFTTRPDTIYGVTFMVISAQHPRLMELVTKKQKKEVENFLKKIKSTSEKDIEELKKEGAFTGSYAINPLTKEKVPVYAGNFVIAEYGSGMVMAVPAHDQRDFEFAKKYNIPIKIVIQNKNKSLDVKGMERAYTEDGVLVNSDRFNGISSKDAIEKISDYIEKQGLGKRVTQYRLRDWLISRQRYWGTPIPIIYCDKCGIVPVAEKDLPVVLPEKVAFGKGNPLETNKEFVNIKCPKCGRPAKRETDTMDTFVNSSWYFLRYCDPNNNKEIFDKKKVKYWMPIDQYIGGKEHACMHLIYFRFYTKFLRDLGLLDFDEPAINLFNQGMLHGSDGAVMSKSRGNVVLPEKISKKYGTDAARLFLVSIASPDKDIQWSDKGVEGCFRFIKKFCGLFDLSYKSESTKRDRYLINKMNISIKKTTELIENFKLNLAIIELMEFVNYIIEYKGQYNKSAYNNALKTSCLLFAPFIPHICEELWERLGNKNFIAIEKWPEYDPKVIDLKLGFEEKLIEQTVIDINEIKKLAKIVPRKITVFVSPTWKYDVYNLVLEGKELKQIMQQERFKRIGKEVAAYVQKLQKRKPLEELFLTTSAEHKAFTEAKEFLEKEFNCKIEIASAEKAVHAKAKSAEPAKPGILVG